MNLEHRFIKLISQYTEDYTLIITLWKDIEIQYSEKSRAYHNLNHIIELFNYFDTYKKHLGNPNIVAFSIFYHDIIYNIWKKDNEERSAEYAVKQLLKINLVPNFLDTIHQQIIATKTHVANENDAKWFVDFDLAILGKSSEEYQNYAQLIREEYKLIPSLLYKKGRKKVLQHFINKPFIYSTELFRDLYEKQAKINLETELNS